MRVARKLFVNAAVLLVLIVLCPAVVRASSAEIESAADVQPVAESTLEAGDGAADEQPVAESALEAGDGAADVQPEAESALEAGDGAADVQPEAESTLEAGDGAADVQPVGESTLEAGDGVTLTFDAETGEVIFYSDGGTLWKDWDEKAGLNYSDIKSIKAADDTGTVYLPADSNEIFADLGNCTTLDLSHFDTSKVTNMGWMFYECSSLTALDLSNFDTSNVTEMNLMFYECSSLTALDLSSFDTSNVTGMGSMFYDCKNLESLNLDSFDTSNVETMGEMFRGCSKIKSLDLTGFDTSNVTNMYGMFALCDQAELDISSFDTSKVKYMDQMFLKCGVVNLDLSNFDTSNVTSMSAMFVDCANLKSLNLSSFDTSKLTSSYTYNMFRECSSLETLWTPRINNIDSIELPYTMYDAEGSAYSNLPVTSESILLTELSQMIVGDGVTATFDEETGEVVFYSDGGTLWKDWDEKAGLNYSDIKSIKAADDSGTVYLPSDSEEIFAFLGYIKDMDLSHFDTSKVTNMSWMFRSCSSLTALDLSNFDTSNVTEMYYMFFECSSLTALDLSSFDTSNVTGMGSMFYDCKNLESLNLDSFDTSNVTGMYNMFYECSSLTALDLSSFDTSNVTDMHGMFALCDQAELDVSSFDTSKVTKMYGMFRECGAVKLDLSNFDTSNVTDMSGMFANCAALKSLNLSSFDTSKLTSSYNMFGESSSLEILRTPKTNNIDSIGLPHTMYDDKGSAYSNLPVTSESILLVDRSSQFIVGDGVTATFDEETGEVVFYSDGGTLWKDWDEKAGLNYSDIKSIKAADDTGTVYLPADSNEIFADLGNCTTLDLSHFDTSKVTNMGWMFYECSSLTALDLSNFDTSNVTEMYCMFYECSSLKTLDLSSFDTSKVTDMSNLFLGCSGLSTLDLSGFDTSSVTDMSGMFSYCSNLKNLDMSHFDTSKVTNMSRMFRSCSSLTALDLSNFDTSNVTEMYYMFYECSSLTALDLSSFDTSNVTGMGCMFYDCKNLESLNLDSFDTSNVTEMDYMFYECSSLTALDLSSFDTSNVTNMSYMFSSCGQAELDVSSFDTSKVKNMYCMFYQCGAVELDLSNFDTSNVTSMSGMFVDCANLKSLNLSSFDTSKISSAYNMFGESSSLETLWTPRTNNIDGIELPCTMYDAAGNAYSSLPITQESILLAETQEMAQEASAVAFKSNSLILGDSIGVKFYMNLFPLTADERSAGYMTFEISGAGTCTERADFDASLTNEAGYYGFICRVNAVQMADTITATYHYGDGQTISAEYSVRRYIELFNENKDLYDQTVQDMVRALADYGHYVQLFLQDERGWTLGTGDDQYAPMDLFYAESYDLDGIRTALSGSAAVCSVDNACIRALSLSLVLDSETEIRVYVTPADGVNGDDLVFTLGGEAVTAEKTGSRYVVTIPGISAHNLGDTYTLTAQQNGETAATLQASALSYVQILLNASAYADNTNALDASASIYAYYAAANAYTAAN